MRILVLLVSHEMNINYIENIKILNDFLTQLPNSEISYCGISNQNDFSNYESLITFKYKVVNPKLQFSKVCDFISDHKYELDYDWYIKIRPDIKLLEPINFETLSDVAINARARVYVGPKKIKYGLSVEGEGGYKHIKGHIYNMTEREIILDDQIFIFHSNLIYVGAFNKIGMYSKEDELVQTNIWKMRNMTLNVIGLNVILTKYGIYSGDINM